MPGKRYSAGAIFLQVVPVFANVQNAIEREAKNIDRALGDQMEKSGDEAGRRAGKAASKSMNDELKKGSGQFERDFRKNIDGINQALDGIDTKRLGNGLRRELAEVKKELAGLKDVDIAIDANSRDADHKIAELEGRIRALRDAVKIIFRADIDAALRGFGKIEAMKDAIADPVEIEVKVDTKPAQRAMTTFEREFKKSANRAADSLGGSMHKEIQRLRDELKYLSNLRIGIDISAGQAHREMAEIQAELEVLQHENIDIDVKVDAARAVAELLAVQALVNRIDGQDAEVDVKTDKARGGLLGLAASGDTASNSFRSFNFIMLAVTTAGPALIPILGAIGGALVALGPAAAVAVAGLGAVVVGFSGIGNALTALQNRQDHMATSTQTMAKTEEASARRVADARRSAARAVASALDAQKSAQERYAQSIQDVKDAEQALAEARQAARSTGADIKEKISDNQRAQDQGLLDVFNATVTYNSTMADGSATNAEQEQARINLENARDALSDLRKEAKELAKEKKKWDKQGVDGTDQVKAAQDQLSSALDAQKEAYKSLRDAAQQVDQARADGARQVRDALDEQATAMENVNAQQVAVEAAMAKLGPAGRQFARFLFAMRKSFYAFRDDIQQVLLPSVQEAIEGFIGSKAGKIARKSMIRLAGSFGQFTIALSKSFRGKAWTGFFEMLGRIGPKIQKAYGKAFIKFAEALASMITTAAPFALRFARGLAGMMTAFANWAKSKKGQDAFLRFLDWCERVGPDVLAFVGSLVDFLVAAAEALAPWGDVVLKVMTGLMDVISGLDPKVLGPILTAIIVLIASSQIAYGFMTIMLAWGVLASSALAPWILGIGAVVAVLSALYVNNKEFRDFVKKAWKEISEAFQDAWEKYIKPALDDLMKAFTDLWEQVLRPFFRWLGPIIVWLAKHLIPLIAIGVSNMAKIFAWEIEHVIIPAFKWFGRTAKSFWYDFLKPIFHAIGVAWGALGDAWQWTVDNVFKPLFEWFTETALPNLEEGFHNTIDAIKSIWDGLKAIVAAPIKFVIETVLNNGLIAGFNKVAKWVGMSGFDPIPIPGWMQSYATGGIMPGYTPGRDVHKFVSPTGGRLELSGGEAVMRPEWTAAMGPAYVNQMNAIARSGGTRAVQKAMGMGGYWNGGILPLPGAHVSSHGTSYPFPAFDLNVGSGYDDFGMAIKAWKDGLVAQMKYIGDQSYGRYVVLNHAGNQSSLYAHMSNFGSEKVGDFVRAGQTIGYVGDLGNTGTPPTSHLHFEIRGGLADLDVGAMTGGITGPPTPHIPGWLKDIVLHPLRTVKDWITEPISKASSFLKSSPVFDFVTHAPLHFADAAVDKVMGVIPGWVKSGLGIKSGGHNVELGAPNTPGAPSESDGSVSAFLGGILPYNGTMKYDSGGYLPPGMTNVVNLTGKPEPVFTSQQWDNMDHNGGGLVQHYEPHFEGSDLTAEDVAADLNFAFRKLGRRGKYATVGGS